MGVIGAKKDGGKEEGGGWGGGTDIYE